MEDGIRFEVYAISNGQRIFIKDISLKEFATSLSATLLDGVFKAIEPDPPKEETDG